MRLATCLCLFLFTSALFAANGDSVGGWRNNGQFESREWLGLDAEGAVVAAGTAVYVGPFNSLTFWPLAGTVDAGDTWEVDCNPSNQPDTAPTTGWSTVHAASSSETPRRMVKGDHCNWFRVNKPTDTDDNTTVTVNADRMRLIR